MYQRNMHCKELHLDNLKCDFLRIFKKMLHPQIPDFQIVVSLPNIVKPYINGKRIYSAFRWCIKINLEKLTLMTGFVVQGHICFALTESGQWISSSQHALHRDGSGE